MLRDLITSFWAQDLDRAELVIHDDASTDGTQAFMEAVVLLDDRIVYARNEKNVGLTENTRRALLLARGAFVLILGDDDVLLGEQALSSYVDIFERHPDAHFAYANQIQMDRELNFDFAYPHFAREISCPSGEASFRNLWLKSIQTAGVALRRTNELYSLYPKSPMLFPQVELVGRVLARHGSCGIPKYLIGVRSHADQLGFHANRGRRIIGPEKHGTIEILDIAVKLNEDEKHAPALDYTARILTRALATNLPHEKVRGSTRIAVSNARGLMRKSAVARRDPILLLSVLITAATPSPVLDWLRGLAKSIIRRRYVRDAKWFSAELRRQRDSYADRWRELDKLSRSTA
jgi:glycosyltransferase involved in cell wall biosynthesis